MQQSTPPPVMPFLSTDLTTKQLRRLQRQRASGGAGGRRAVALIGITVVVAPAMYMVDMVERVHRRLRAEVEYWSYQRVLEDLRAIELLLYFPCRVHCRKKYTVHRAQYSGSSF